MNRRKYFTRTQTDEIIEKLKQQTSPSAIAREMNIGKNRVDEFIVENNIPLISQQSRAGEITSETAKIFCNKSAASNYKINSIIKKYNVLDHTKCCSCGLDQWIGNPIKLELDHIDGDNRNNEITNLRYICPNCHSYTTTYKGKSNTGKQKVSDEQMLEAIKEFPDNTRKVLLKVGLTPKGANYDRVYRLKAELFQNT